MDDKKLRGLKKESATLARMIEIYCRHVHSNRNRSSYQPSGRIATLVKNRPVEICSDCRKLLSYALSMRLICPLDPKPRCKKCPSPCYRDAHRREIREVMRFSGWWMIRHGRLDLIRKMWG